jgi:hypothetical protein
MTSGANMNTLTERPIYRCPGTSIASTVVNGPSDLSTTYGFILINIQPYGVAAFSTQVIIQQSSLWVRNQLDNTDLTRWSTWKKISYVA